MLHPSVREGWLRFSIPKEGRIRWMYRDVRGLVTVAVGLLIDPVNLALRFKWYHRNSGALASEAEVRAEWARIKAAPGLEKGGAPAAEMVATLWMSDADVDAETLRTFDTFAVALARSFPRIGSWPVSAQAAVMSLAWAVGTDLPTTYPRMTAALRAEDFATAALECLIREEGNAGVAVRNATNMRLLKEAAMERGQFVPPVNISLDTVLGLQTALTRLGYSLGPVDGILGMATRHAVRQFQQMSGLKVDGVAGPMTKAALRAALSAV